ncbi:hypothetical protein [Microbacterium sp. A93]|uniref:hypothetical protein n=1 Tax=Microbacterium sp. A93 TaxID=3450716 RepID=UPI003F4326D4
MTGPLVTTASTVQCSHAGQAQGTSPAARVLVDGSPAILATAPWSIAGCPFPPNAGGPCATATWTVSSLRVTSMNQPLVLATGMATCVPTGVPLMVVSVQSRAVGT